MVNFATIPLIAMSASTRNILSALLNPPKVLQTCDKCFRDWRGFAGALDVGGEANPLITTSPDPTAAILDHLKSRDVTIEALIKALEKIDRHDIVEDAIGILEKDATIYLERLQKGNAPEIDVRVDNEMLTYDDQIRYEKGLPMQSYDAFLLYAEEDTGFANEIIHNLESEDDDSPSLRLCTRDRDLICRGERFEPEILMQLIAKRCTRLIVVLSPNFIRTPVNTFLMDFGQSMGLIERRRKVVPVLYQDCDVPIQMQHTVMLHYRKELPDFWRRFKRCIRTVTPPSITPDKSCKISDGEKIIPKITETVEDKLAEKHSMGILKENNSTKFNTMKKIRLWWVKRQHGNEDQIVQLPSLSGLDDLKGSDDGVKRKKKRAGPKWMRKLVPSS